MKWIKMGLFVTSVRFLLLLVIQPNNAEEENINNCVPSCLGDWEKEGDRCYLWPWFRSNWRKADEYCMKEGGHLASVTNIKIHNYIQSKVTIGQIDTYFWIGGTDQAQEGDWRWTDGSPWTFTMWGPRQPDNWASWGHDEDCLQINLDWRSKNGWNDIKCNTDIKFVCSQPLCADYDTNISTSNNTNGHNSTGHPPGLDNNTTLVNSSKNKTSDFPVTAVATSQGYLWSSPSSSLQAAFYTDVQRRKRMRLLQMRIQCMVFTNLERCMKDSIAQMRLLMLIFIMSNKI